VIVDQEGAFEGQLTEIYGTPYPGEIGPGKTYAQGYTGPDLLEWFIVDRATEMVDTTAALTISAKVPTGVATFTGFTLADITNHYATQFNTRTITFQPDRFVHFADQWAGGASLGQRSVTGTLQQALLDTQQAYVSLKAANHTLQDKYAIFERHRQLALAMVTAHTASVAKEKQHGDEIDRLARVQVRLEAQGSYLIQAGEAIDALAQNFAEFFPRDVGFSNDMTSAARGTVRIVAGVIGQLFKFGGLVSISQARSLDVDQASEQRTMDQAITELGFTYEQAQFIFEHELLLRDLTSGFYEIAQLATALQRANENTRNLMAQGDGIQADRETFRQRAAAIIQGYRTKDVTFRTFRNEAL
ncbi:MAG: hypothetical protein Q7R45_11555, partial [Sulfuricaulis sp.]|nr:hypothetical protein [Sulfuricaulis sp.]